MPAIDVWDESFVCAAPAVVAARLRDPAVLRRWWPDLRLTVFEDRGEAGIRWSVTGALVGSTEVWLEPCLDGVLVHYFLRAELADGPGSPRRAARITRRRQLAFKRVVWALKDELEADRPAGSPPEVSRRPEPGGVVQTGRRTADH
jgi:hypothetical protein